MRGAVFDVGIVLVILGGLYELWLLLSACSGPPEACIGPLFGLAGIVVIAAGIGLLAADWVRRRSSNTADDRRWTAVVVAIVVSVSAAFGGGLVLVDLTPIHPESPCGPALVIIDIWNPNSRFLGPATGQAIGIEWYNLSFTHCVGHFSAGNLSIMTEDTHCAPVQGVQAYTFEDTAHRPFAVEDGRTANWTSGAAVTLPVQGFLMITSNVSLSPDLLVVKVGSPPAPIYISPFAQGPIWTCSA